jgi:hypothetical protein
MNESTLPTGLAGGALAVTCGALLVSALRRGSMRLRGGRKLHRKDHPTAFWVHIAVLVGLCALGGGMIAWALVNSVQIN